MTAGSRDGSHWRSSALGGGAAPVLPGTIPGGAIGRICPSHGRASVPESLPADGSGTATDVGREGCRPGPGAAGPGRVPDSSARTLVWRPGVVLGSAGGAGTAAGQTRRGGVAGRGSGRGAAGASGNGRGGTGTAGAVSLDMATASTRSELRTLEASPPDFGGGSYRESSRGRMTSVWFSALAARWEK